MMQVNDVFERKDRQYKVVAKVEHESDEGEYVYLIAEREFGRSEVSYFSKETEFDSSYKQTNHWLG